MPHVKLAEPDHPVEPFITDRWSPYWFDSKPVDRAQLLSCLEAARWSASSYNEQPWSFILAERSDAEAFATMLECLVEANQGWAQHAGVLILTVVQRHFARNGKPNRVAEHDLGLAVGNLSCQATVLGLHVHQMAGVNLAKARQTYQIPDTHEPCTAIAIGHAAAAEDGNELSQRDQSPRTRKPLSELVFAGKFGQSSDLV